VREGGLVLLYCVKARDKKTRRDILSLTHTHTHTPVSASLITQSFILLRVRDVAEVVQMLRRG
jgi:hypothetical protein